MWTVSMQALRLTSMGRKLGSGGGSREYALSLDDAGVGEDEIEPIAGGHKDGLENLSQVRVARQFDLMEVDVGVRPGFGYLVALLLVGVQDVYLPSPLSYEGLDYAQAHPAGYM